MNCHSKHIFNVGHNRAILPLVCALLLAGCQSLSVSPDTQKLAPFELAQDGLVTYDLPDGQSPESLAPPTNWLNSFNDPQLHNWVETAINTNFDLQEARARVEAARQQRRIAGASLWPSLDLGVDGQRAKSQLNSNDSSFSNQYQAGLDIAWEIDLWGKLDDQRDAADYLWQAEQALYNSSKLSIASQVAKAWYNVNAQHLLTQLFRERVTNLDTNLDIIESGYHQGINSALDVYLARTDLASVKSNLEQQLATEQEAIRTLQLLLGQFPSGQLEPAQNRWQLPDLSALDAEQLNAQTVRHRYDLQASFLALLASDRDLAAAHKARFPSFRLTGRAGDSSDELNNLFDASSLAWNLLGNLTQPVFAGGRLQAQEQQQQAVVQQKEQQYLQTLYTAFSEVEQSLTNETALKKQLVQVSKAKELAEAAEELAFEEYRQGLEDYTSVLEAQRRAFNAQDSLISLRYQLLENRINLYLALGGDFD